jgi:hypothetical protein
MTNEEVLTVLSDAVALGETTLVIRNGDAIAEVMGQHRYTLEDGWVTIAQEQGSHVHLKAEDVVGLRYSDEQKGKPATCGLEVLGADETPAPARDRTWTAGSAAARDRSPCPRSTWTNYSAGDAAD